MTDGQQLIYEPWSYFIAPPSISTKKKYANQAPLKHSIDDHRHHGGQVILSPCVSSMFVSLTNDKKN